MNNPFIDEEDERSTEADAAAREGATTRRRRKKVTQGSRFVLRGKYEDTLRWIDKAMYSTSEQVAVYLETSNADARGILSALERYGYLRKKNFTGYPLAYYLTQWGKEAIDSGTRPVSSETGPAFIRHAVLTGWTMMGLIKNKGDLAAQVNVATGVIPDLDDFLTEPEINAALAVVKAEAQIHVERAAEQVRGHAVARTWQVWDRVGQLAVADRQAGVGSDFQFALFGGRANYHVPDLVLRLPRDADGDPMSIAFEIERTKKPASQLAILEAYRVNFEEDRLAYPLTPNDFPTRQDFDMWEFNHSRSLKDVRQYRAVLWVCGDRKVFDSTREHIEQVFGKSDQKGNVGAFTADRATAWKQSEKAQLEQEAAKRKAERKAAVARGFVHITGHKEIKPCTCGTTCRAKYGAFASKTDALDVLEEIA